MLSYLDNHSFDRLKGVGRKKHRAKQCIIRYLYLHGGSTCNDISLYIKLSIPSVQVYINELVAEGIIMAKGQGNSTGGRRPNIYDLNGNSFFLLCIDIGRFNVRMAILDGNMKIINGIQSYELAFQDDVSYLKQIYEIAEDLIVHKGIDKEKLVAIGLDMPGVIDAKKGINYSYFYHADETLAEALEKRFKLPVFLENDTNVRALAEYRLGKAKGRKNALVIFLSWGIGLGMINNGKLYQGSSGFAGEFSHIPVVDNGKLCWCKKQGCLETVASASALSALAKEGMHNGQESAVFEHIDNSKDYVEPGIVINAANQGDQFSVKILSEVGHELGKGIAILIQILNPEVIILEGVMSQAKQYITTPIQHTLNSHCNPILLQDLKIETTDFGEEAAILGSAIWVADQLLTN